MRSDGVYLRESYYNRWSLADAIVEVTETGSSLRANRLRIVDTVLKSAAVGGAQAIAVLAYGTKSIPRVGKIFGLGNKYVTAAKQLVSADCAIDLPAGPTEAIVFAEHGNARWIAADLLAQAEHATDAASFFVTTSRRPGS